MVYRGKPSAACGECRKRRSRCDQAVPSCGQCIKARRLCPGYRNTVDLMFHDESTQIVQKNKGRVASDTQLANSRRAGSSSSKDGHSRGTTTSPVKLTDIVMYQPLDDLGVHFFMSNYVGEDPTTSQLYYLPSFFAKTGYANPGLQQSITAAGLAGYAKSSRRRDMIDLATKHYVDAVQGINTALSDPKTAAHDTTLMCIILAAMFEIMIIPRGSGMQNCTKHLHGAVVVAFLNLEQGKPSEVMRKLLTTLVQSVIINCWIQNIPLPPRFQELKKLVDERINSNPTHGSFLDIIMELVQLKHDLKSGRYESPMAIIRKSVEIDEMLSGFAQHMPPQARFDSFRVSNEYVQQLAFQGYYHIYPQRFTAHLWNNIRSSRLRLHQVILQQCHTLTSPPTLDPHTFLSIQKSTSEALITSMAKEIMATVPQLAGYLEQLEGYRISPELDPSALDPDQTSASSIRSTALSSTTSSTLTFHSPQSTAHPPPPTTHPAAASTLTPTPTPSSSPSATTPHIASQTPFFAPSLPPSLYHILYQLYALPSIPHLPAQMRAWTLGRITWLESIADPGDLARLQDMMRKNPGDGFPVGGDGEFRDMSRGHGGEGSLMKTGGDRRVWLSVHNWFSVGWEKLGQQGSSDEWWGG